MKRNVEFGGNMKKVNLYHNFIKPYAFYLLFSLSLIGMTGCNAQETEKPTIEVNGNLEETPSSTIHEEISEVPQETETPEPIESSQPIEKPVEQSTQDQVAKAEIHFIDTGNSDAILIKADQEAMLIDGGDNDDEQLVVNYLKKQGITELKYVVATHPHADHIGGLDAVINNVTVKQLLVANGDADTKTYRDFINAAMNKGLSPSVPLEGSQFTLGNSYFTVMNTNGGSDANNQSLVIEYINGKDHLLFMGDAEKEVEEEILSKLSKVDLLKVGHHGSSTSTTKVFLEKVNPTYAVILCGKDNKYGHPHRETMLKLEDIEVHRNDECGNIIFESTGNGLVTTCKVGSYTPGSKSTTESSTTNNIASHTTSNKESITSNNASTSTQKEERPAGSSNIVYWTPNGKSYHTTKGCSTLSRSKTILSGSISESGKYDPCDRCH